MITMENLYNIIKQIECLSPYIALGCLSIIASQMAETQNMQRENYRNNIMTRHLLRRRSDLSSDEITDLGIKVYVEFHKEHKDIEKTMSKECLQNILTYHEI